MATSPKKYPLTAHRIRDALRISGLKTDAFEDDGIPVRTLRSWLAGSAEPPASKICAIAKRCGVTADFLVGLRDHYQLLPPDRWVVDLDFVEAVREGRWHPELGEQGAFAIPPRYSIETSIAKERLEQELGPYLRGVEKKRGRKQ